MRRIYLSYWIIALILVGCSSPPVQTEEIASSTSLPSPQIRITPGEKNSNTPLQEDPTQTQYPEEQITPAEDETPITLGPRSFFGVEIVKIETQDWVDLALESGIYIHRHNALFWPEIEPQPGVRNWEGVEQIDNSLEEFGSKGLDTILIVHGAPYFAQKVPGYQCGPIAEEHFSTFAKFMEDVVLRYSQPPYNIRYYEIGNEPDVGIGVVKGNSVFGCWGDRADPNFGGGYYAEMLKVVYPAIKATNPDAQVLIGGLLMDCDPSNPPEGKTCQETKFFEGILENGGGDYFDIVSYHAYVGYSNEAAFDERWIGWEERGGVILGKLDYLKELLEKYGFEKQIFLTESSMTCPDWNKAECTNPGEAFYQTQAQFVPRLYLRNWAHGIDGTIWYQFDGPGWRYGGLAGPIRNPKPSLSAFQYLSEILGDAYFLDVQQDDDGFVVYRFQRGDQEIWSVWTPDWQERSYTVPDDVQQITDIYGNEIDFSSGKVNAGGVLYLTFTEENN